MNNTGPNIDSRYKYWILRLSGHLRFTCGALVYFSMRTAIPIDGHLVISAHHYDYDSDRFTLRVLGCFEKVAKTFPKGL